MRPPKLKQLLFFIPLIVLVVFLLGFSIVSSHHWTQQFSFLAQSFLHGKLYFLHSIGGISHDPVVYHHRIYWSEGPFPAIMLLPFVAIGYGFHFFFYQGYISWLLSLGTLYFIYKIGRKYSYSPRDSLLLALTFALGSVYIAASTITGVYTFAQVVTVFLLFWVMYEYLVREKTRWWLIGIISAFIVLTRASAAPIIVFFLLELVTLVRKDPKKTKNFLALLLPVALAVALVGIYNFLRFHNFFQSGYKYQLAFPRSAASKNLGVLNPIHIPANLYSLVLRPPLTVLRSANSWTLKFPFIKNNMLGMSMFITSPYLLYLFSQKWKSYSGQLKRLLIASGLSILVVLSVFAIGGMQYGYRYSLDFLPELFVVFMVLYRKHNSKLSFGMQSLLIASIVINCYLFLPALFTGSFGY